MKDEYSLSVKSLFGRILIISNENYIQEISFIKKGQKLRKILKELPSILLKAKLQIEEYLRGERRCFSLPLERSKGTPFQKKVWSALQKIPFGETRSYFDIAQSIGNEKSCRAVGNANNKNPFVLVVPCHRVIQKNGDLGGFGAGTEMKRWLLFHERVINEKG